MAGKPVAGLQGAGAPVAGLQVVGSVAGVPEWDAALPDRDTFYASRAWLEFTDSDGEAGARYCATSPVTDGPEPAAGAVLVAHRTRRESNARYQPNREVRALAGCRHALTTYGGRRGHRSAPVPARDLTALMATTDAAFADPADGWWWPYLDTAQMTAVVAARPPADRMPAVALQNVDGVLDVPGAGFADYLAGLPTKRRRYNVRQEMRRFAEAGLTVRRQRLSECWELGGTLASNVQRKYGHDHPPALMADVLRRQAERLDELSVVFACYDGPRMIAFCLAYHWRSELVIRLVGFDYDRLRDAFEYPQLVFYSPLEYCYDHGLTSIHLGTGGLAAKRLRGARLRPLWAVADCPCVPAGGPDTEQVGNGRLAALAESLPDADAERLVEEVTAAARQVCRPPR